MTIHNTENTALREEFKPSLFILVMLISFGTVSAVLFTPALPEIASYFVVDNAVAQWTLSLFLLGYAAARWVCEVYRVPDATYVWGPFLLTQGQLLSLPMFVIGAYFLWCYPSKAE